MRTPCGMRTVVTILEIFAELLGDTFGKVPCYNTVENWVKKLGLSVYQDEQPCKDKKFAMVVDESIAINGQKLLLTLAIPSEHQGRPIKHEDVTILDMSVGKGCKRFRDASRYTSKKISLKLLFLSDIFLFPFVRQQFPILAYRCSWRQCCCFVDNIGYIFKEVNTLQSAGACKRIEHGSPFGTSMRPEEK